MSDISTHLHARRASLPFVAQTAQQHALMIRRWIAVHKVWMRQNPMQPGRERLRELVGIFREDCAALDRTMARRDSFFAEVVDICRPAPSLNRVEDARSLININAAAE